MNDNIVMKKVWQEGDLLELEIMCSAEYVTAYQTCYIQAEQLEAICEQISICINQLQPGCYMEFGKKTGNYTPAFSMEIIEISKSGHVKIEVDLEIDDNNSRKHRCCFYVDSELGLVITFGEKLKALIEANVGEEVILNPCY